MPKKPTVIGEWRRFSKAVEKRLLRKQREGFTGWDGKYPSNQLKQEIIDDVVLLEGEVSERKLCEDIAARSMMLWRRSQEDG